MLGGGGEGPEGGVQGGDVAVSLGEVCVCVCVCVCVRERERGAQEDKMKASGSVVSRGRGGTMSARPAPPCPAG